MSVKLEKIWVNEFDGRQELRFDWSNDRHHAVVVHPPHGAEQVANALEAAALLIYRERCLLTD